MSHIEIVNSDFGEFLLETTAIGICSVKLPGSPRLDMTIHNDPSDHAATKHAATAKRELLDYLSGKPTDFETPIDFTGRTLFQQDVLRTLRDVPFGMTVSYKELASLAGYPNACRAVGGVMKGNRTPIFVPCHRVLAAGHRIGGWSGVPGWKERLLAIEGVQFCAR